MSVSPAQNFSKPPPVPEVPTVTRTPGFSLWNSSATASVSGATVLEPSMRIVPERSPPPPLPLVVVVAAAGRDADRQDGRGGDDREPLELVTLSPSGLSLGLPAQAGRCGQTLAAGSWRPCYAAWSRL